MNTYSLGAFLKFSIGAIILSILYKYVNIYESPELGLSFGFLGTFMIIWGAMYFFFLGLYKLRGNETSDQSQSSYSYKLSLIFALCIMLNLTLMINNKRTNAFGIISLLGFFLFIPLLSVDTQHDGRDS